MTDEKRPSALSLTFSGIAQGFADFVVFAKLCWWVPFALAAALVSGPALLILSIPIRCREVLIHAGEIRLKVKPHRGQLVGKNGVSVAFFFAFFGGIIDVFILEALGVLQ